MSTVEQVRAYWDSRPCNVLHGTAPVGTLEWSRQVTERKYFVESHIPGFAQFERWRGKRVLEIGCGIGTDTLKFLKSGAYVTAVDISSKSINIAKQREHLEWIAGNPTLEFFNCDAEKSVPSGSYDLAYSFGVLHHTPHPQKILRNVRNYMYHGGELRVMLYAKWSIKHLLREQPESQAGCPIVRWYSKRAARKLIEDAGFKVESITKTHIFPWRVEDYVQHRYVMRAAYRWMPEWFFSWLERRLGHHLLIVARKA